MKDLTHEETVRSIAPVDLMRHGGATRARSACETATCSEMTEATSTTESTAVELNDGENSDTDFLKTSLE